MLGQLSHITLEDVTTLFRGQTGNRVIDPAVSVGKVVAAYLVAQRVLAAGPISNAYWTAGIASATCLIDLSDDPDPLYESGVVSLMAGAQMAALAKCFPHAYASWGASKGLMAIATLSALEMGFVKSLFPFVTWDEIGKGPREASPLESIWSGPRNSGVMDGIVSAAQAALVIKGAAWLAPRLGSTNTALAALTYGTIGLSHQLSHGDDEGFAFRRELKAWAPMGMLIGACGAAAWMLGSSTRQAWTLRSTMSRPILSAKLFAGVSLTALALAEAGLSILDVMYELPTDHEAEIDRIWTLTSGSRSVRLAMGLAQAYGIWQATQALSLRFGTMQTAAAAAAVATLGNGWGLSDGRQDAYIAPRGLLLGLGIASAILFLEQARLAQVPLGSFWNLRTNRQLMGAGVGMAWAVGATAATVRGQLKAEAAAQRQTQAPQGRRGGR